jgi:uncharacterized repeat protein (TIGR02543 family)
MRQLVSNNATSKMFRFASFTLVVILALSISTQWSAAATPGFYHSVTFAQNDNPSDPIYATQTQNVPTPLTSFVNLSPPFTKPGFTFESWNTSADGTGLSYVDGATFDFAAATVLFAIWTSLNHSVTFAQNDSVNDPIFLTQTANAPTSLTLFTNLKPLLFKQGYTFGHWNTSANGTGTSYVDGAIFDFAAATVLYAIWTATPTATASFLVNGGTGTIAPVTYPVGSATTLPAISGITNPGYTFVGWNTAANGSGTSYLSGSSYVFTGDQTLYAQWAANVYQVTYSANGGSVSPSISNYTVGTSALVLPTPTSTGFDFNGWFTAVAGGTLIGLGGAAYSPNATSVLYAQWTQVVTDTLTFNANGGSGVVAPISGPHGSSITLPGQLGLLHAGFVLSRWTSTSKGSGTSYIAGETIKLSGSSILYAQWTGHASAVLLGAVGNFSKNSSSLTAALKREVKHLALSVRGKKYHSILLYGYTATTGLQSLNLSLSRARAVGVANYLRAELRVMNVKGVSIACAGEGAIAGGSSAAYSRVEVFVL